MRIIFQRSISIRLRCCKTVLMLTLFFSPSIHAQQATPVFVGTSPPISDSTATLILNDNLSTQTSFQWQSSDSILGNIDTGEVNAVIWNFFPGTGSRPDRLIFTGGGDGAQLKGNVLFDPYNRAVADVTKNGRRVRYLLTDIKVDSINLTIHKPLVIDAAETAIADAVELTKGVQTFVNLDNDDTDTHFDTGAGDQDVANEDEMSKLILRLEGKNLTRGEVKITTTQGGDKVKIWRSANKGNAYTSGTVLKVPGDFTVNGNVLSKQLWVEGIAPHNTQQGTKLKMSYNMAPQLSDEVALTVIGIESIIWKGKNNSRNDNNTLEADTNHPAGLLPSALRVFPDARTTAAGAVEASPRDKVDAEVTLSVAPIEPLKIYLDSFDVDDPTDNKTPVDDDTKERDNRGVPADGKFTGEAGGVIEKIFSNQKETVELQVTMQPGDNFRVAANGDKDFLLALRNDESKLGANNVDKLRIVDPAIAGTPAQKEIRDITKYASNILTVWRFLHVEADSMGVVTGNKVSGNIVALVPPGSGSATRVNVDNNLDDGSRNLDNAPAGKGRHEKGDLVVAATTSIKPVDGNGRKRIDRAAGTPVTSTPLPFSATDNDLFGNATLGGSISIITQSGGKWILKLNVTSSSETPTDWADFKGGTISVAAGPAMSITDSFAFITSVEVAQLRLPYTLTDDDTILDDVPDPDTSGIEATYQPAYIVPLFDTGKNNSNVPFVLNSEDGDINNQIKSGKGVVDSTNRYWVVTILNAYQPNTKEDNDPNKEGTYRGWARRAVGVHGVFMATESIRDWIATPAADEGGNNNDPASAGRQTRYQEILNHEVGHLFGLLHPDGNRKLPAEPNGGVMNPTCCPPDDPTKGTRGASTFTKTSLAKIRKRPHPGN